MASSWPGSSRRGRGAFGGPVLTPLWASYLVKVYAWRAMLAADGVVDWLLPPFGLSSPGFGLAAIVIVLTYLWLPFMILPVYAGFERLPDSCSTHPPTSGRGRPVPSDRSCCRWCSRRWSPARSSPSR